MPRIFNSEYVYSYATYTFGYAVYAERIGTESLDPIWNMGFLPYSGDHRADVTTVFYLTRSVRADLALFVPTSENRRVKRKFEDRRFDAVAYPGKMFLENDAMLDFCLSNFADPKAMSKARLKRILGAFPEVTVIEYKDEKGDSCAYVIEVLGENSVHHWYNFFIHSPQYQSFGMWLFLDRMENLKSLNKKYYYLGTLYGEKAMYKMNIPGLEFWNSNEWSSDMSLLKKLARTDAERSVSHTDQFKVCK